MDTNGEETFHSYTKDGTNLRDGVSYLDLVNIPETTTKYVNVYAGEFGDLHGTMAEARRFSEARQCKGTMKLTFQDDKLISSEVVDV